MKYYIDCEFDGMGGPLLSMAIVSQTGRSMYVTMRVPAKDPWVRENVIPILFDIPINVVDRFLVEADAEGLSTAIESFFSGDLNPHVVSDWPDDIKYLCEALLTGPGKMIRVPTISFEVVRVDAYPSTLKGAIQHNAWWDAMALRHLILNGAR